MLRRIIALVSAVLASVTLVLVGTQSTAIAWTAEVSTSTYYYTHAGRLYIYGRALGHNWGCSAFGLAMDCADGQDLYALATAYDTYPDAMQVQTSISFSGQGLSVGIPANVGGSVSGWTCTQPAFSSGGTFVSVTTNGVVCHAQTPLVVTGMTLWVTGWGRWGCCWYGASTSGFLDMYP